MPTPTPGPDGIIRPTKTDNEIRLTVDYGQNDGRGQPKPEPGSCYQHVVEDRRSLISDGIDQVFGGGGQHPGDK